MQVRCPQCHTPIELASDGQLSDIACPSCGSSFSLLGTAETVPYETGTKTIGHFELVEQIGVGTFGFVWKARDTELDRTVAIKIPAQGAAGSGRDGAVPAGGQSGGPTAPSRTSSASTRSAASRTRCSSSATSSRA